MIDFSAIPNSRWRSTWAIKRWKLYLFLWLVANGTLWSVPIVYLKATSPTYTSEWKIVLSAAKSSTNVDVPGIGQAVTSSDSPFSSQSSDPRQNYKYLAETDEVLEIAANQLNMSVQKFGKARIKVLDNTTLMQFQIKGNTPQEAREKALALHEALEAKIDQLRKEEIAQQNRILKVVLNSAEHKLQTSQQRLSDYKARSRLSSTDQLRDISLNLEGLRRQRAETAAKLQEAQENFRQLSASLGLSPQQAVDALELQSNQLFQQYLADYSKATAAVVNLSAKYLPNHPAVIDKQKEKDVAQAALLQKARSLLGYSISPAILEQLNLSSSSSSGTSLERAALFQQLIALYAQQQGLEASAQELTRQTTQLESRLTSLSLQSSQLESLQRDVRIGEAVFSSTLTRLDLNKSNISASYPPILIFSKPNLPDKPSSPKSKFALLGAVMGSFFVTAGMTLLWLRKRKIRQAKSTS
jgi:uncharacterized protein involved in exopolysaccharide biosynthesis